MMEQKRTHTSAQLVFIQTIFSQTQVDEGSSVEPPQDLHDLGDAPEGSCKDPHRGACQGRLARAVLDDQGGDHL